MTTTMVGRVAVLKREPLFFALRKSLLHRGVRNLQDSLAREQWGVRGFHQLCCGPEPQRAGECLHSDIAIGGLTPLKALREYLPELRGIAEVIRKEYRWNE
jgi:hypothetical protein